MSIDAAITRFLDGFTSRSCVFDSAVQFLQGTPMLKGLVLFALIWFALFTDGPRARRDDLLSVTAFSVVALAAARVLSLVLPFRARPIHDPTFGFHPACGFVAPRLEGWSSFPSDHAVLYCMLATGVLFASRWLGWIAISYVAVFILLPRVYLGLHWPSDVLAGAALGVAFAYAARRLGARMALGARSEALRAKMPGVFHAGLFVWSYLLLTHFDEVRRLGGRTLSVLHAGLP